MLFCCTDDRENTLGKKTHFEWNTAERLLSEHLVFSNISSDNIGQTVPDYPVDVSKFGVKLFTMRKRYVCFVNLGSELYYFPIFT